MKSKGHELGIHTLWPNATRPNAAEFAREMHRKSMGIPSIAMGMGMGMAMATTIATTMTMTMTIPSAFGLRSLPLALVLRPVALGFQHLAFGL